MRPGPGIALLAATSLLAGCVSPPRWNVLLVTFDTTRADHIGCYGKRRIDTPTLDALAAEGVRFRRALSSTPITLPSHSTIMTGRYPFGHGARDNGLFVLGQDQQTLAEVLREHGYATAAAIGAFPLAARFGIDQGFDFFDDRLMPATPEFLGLGARPRLFFEERRAARVNEAVFGWLERRGARPFFLWVHYYDPHQPHDPPPPYDQLYATDPYAGEIAYADESLGTLLGRLAELGLDRRTLVVFTSDHGEGLGEHGELTHSYLLYDTTLHVPLIFRLPGGAGRVIEEQVGLVDVMPTILDLLGLPVPRRIHGRSLAVHVRGGRAAPRPLYAETLSPRLNHGWGELRALYDGRWKYVHGPRPELFEPAADIRELDDRSAAEPTVVAEMRAKLEALLARYGDAAPSVAAMPDGETLERLRALGYLQGGAAGVEAIREELRRDGAAPQDRIGDVSAMSQARVMLSRGQAFGALQIARQLLESDPHNLFYLEVRANAELMLGRLDDAVLSIEAVLASSPARQSALGLLLRLGHGLFLRQRPEEGLQRVRQSLAARPTATGYHLLASLLAAGEAPQDRREALRRALEIDPAYAPARVDLAIRMAEEGDAERARREFRRALGDRPYDAGVHYNYAAFLLKHGGADGPEVALPHLRRAIDLRPRYGEAYHALIVLHLHRGREAEAASVLESFSLQAPDSPQLAPARRLFEVS